MSAVVESKYRIVVGADLSETGDHALREAVQLARKLPGTELHITYVISAAADMHDARKLAEMSTELQTKLDQLREHVRTVCAPPSGEQPFTLETVFHLRIGDPASAIHQAAVDVDADLIVVGTHGRRGMDKLLLGSVAQELVRSAHLPVLVAHPKQLDGFRKSDRPEPPPSPGATPRSTGLSDRARLEFVPRGTHISGLV
jgi:nucleotide-binding universal stress UspA family protein